jgi:Uma2 family endonuclease
MATTRLYTVQDIEQAPPDGEWELIDGELVEVTPSGMESSRLAHRIGRIVGNYVDAHRLGVMTSADGGYVLFPDRATILVPDVAFIRADRLPPERERPRYPRLAPDLVIEVLSPSDSTSEVVAKVEMYQEAGVPLIWLVDPGKTTITVIAAGDPTEVLKLGDVLSGGEVLPGFAVPVAEIFALYGRPPH